MSKTTFTTARNEYLLHRDDAGTWHEHHVDLINQGGNVIGSVIYSSRSDQKNTTFKIERRGENQGIDYQKLACRAAVIAKAAATAKNRQQDFKVKISLLLEELDD